MCGIFGFAKQSGHQTDAQIDKLRDVFTNLASDSVVRGEDSTGVSIISPDERRTFKSIVASDKIVKHETWRSNILDRIDRESTIGIGHVRLATHGDVTMRNAHPFEIGSVLGAHNGVIHNYNELAKKYNKSIEVDSEVIFAYLNNMSDRDALEKLEGDYALSWVKDSNRIVHLARESSRPISVAYWKKARILLWASTSHILENAMHDAGLTLKHHSLLVNNIYSFNTDKFGSKTAVEKSTFKPKESARSLYSNSGWKYATTYYGGYYDNTNDSCVIDDSPAKYTCETCRNSDYDYNMIDVGDNVSICYECYDDVEACEWCGDYVFGAELVERGLYKVCSLCTNDVSNTLYLPEANGIVSA